MTQRHAHHYVGIDLGTTNSAAAVYNGEAISLVRNKNGETLTPSIVRIDARGLATVGSRARRFLESDPENTRSEFKRLMGTETPILFAGANVSKTPTQLSAEILKSLRQDIHDQAGFFPDCAVISVPALFELPQNAATSAAAKLAGFARVELIQEPIASALAAGWNSAASTQPWLVYDLGGGTLDVSLLQADGDHLRVVGHDGDNFLGGRDFDWAIVDWALQQITIQTGVILSRSDAEYASAFRKLKHLAEEAKIELSRESEVVISIPDWLSHNGTTLHVDVMLDRTTAVRLFEPLVDRSIELCKKLLLAHGVSVGQLEKIVFVGGPTLTPGLRERICSSLQAPTATGIDPMTVVAQGAALYAANLGLTALSPTAKAPPAKACAIWLQYPAVSPDTNPFVLGRARAPEGHPLPTAIRFAREDGQWQSELFPIGQGGEFVGNVVLLPRQSNTFRIEATAASGQLLPTSPDRITLVQGISLGDPPLSRSIGVARADNSVHVYFEKGTPLPARKTFVLKTVEAVSKGDTSGFALKVPIVQGEYEQAHLCRLIGTLDIPSRGIAASVPAGSEVEITLAVDRSGQLTANALIRSISQSFEQIAHLIVPQASIATLEKSLQTLQTRFSELQRSAFRNNNRALLDSLTKQGQQLLLIRAAIAAAEGGDEDAGQKARRDLMELDALLDAMVFESRWPEVTSEARDRLALAYNRVSSYGTPGEQDLLASAGQALLSAIESKDPAELQRQLRIVKRLSWAAYCRSPGVWESMFEQAAAEVSAGQHAVAAQPYILRGQQALASGDTATLKEVVHKLWGWFPVDAEDRKLGFESGVR